MDFMNFLQFKNDTTLFLQGAELDVIPDMIMEGSFKHVGRYITQHSLYGRMGHLSLDARKIKVKDRIL